MIGIDTDTRRMEADGGGSEIGESSWYWARGYTDEI